MGRDMGERRIRDDIEQAHSIEIGMCSACRHPHLLLLDRAGEVFAEAVLNERDGPEFVRTLQGALYQLAAVQGDQD